MDRVVSAELLNPEFFVHGRLLYRFPGSDACRFSPKLAYNLIEHIPVETAERSAVLWDPFCGTGLIISIACLFFGHKFRTFVASDIVPEAVECSRKNLMIVSSGRAAKRRLKHIRGLSKMNPKSERRWGEVAQYLEDLMPAVEQNERLAPSLHTFTASAFELPPGIEGNVHFVGDLPYGRTSNMYGDREIEDLIDCIAAVYPNSTMGFVMTRDIGMNILSKTRGAITERIPCRNGRLIVRVRPNKLDA
jgi:hypothetical protein